MAPRPRKVDDLVKALGADSRDLQSEVSRICRTSTPRSPPSRDRPLGEQRFPYVFLDATYCKARVSHRVVSQAVVIAPESPPTAAARCWALTSATARTGVLDGVSAVALKSRSLTGVQLVISDAHAGAAGRHRDRC